MHTVEHYSPIGLGCTPPPSDRNSNVMGRAEMASVPNWAVGKPPAMSRVSVRVKLVLAIMPVAVAVVWAAETVSCGISESCVLRGRNGRKGCVGGWTHDEQECVIYGCEIDDEWLGRAGRDVGRGE